MNWTTAQLNATKRGHQTEHALQSSCVRWFRNRYPRYAWLLSAIPKGADLGGKTPIARAKNWQRVPTSTFAGYTRIAWGEPCYGRMC